MKKYRRVILFGLMLLLIYFSWIVTRAKPLDNVPKKAKLVNNFDMINSKIFLCKDDFNVRSKLL